MSDVHGTPPDPTMPPQEIATPATPSLISPGRRGGFRAVFSRWVAALWFGSSAFLLFVAAPAAFRASDSSTNAANVVGAMLTPWHYIALILPLLLLVAGWNRARGCLTALLFAGILFAAVQGAIDVRIRTIREESPAAISSLPRDSAVRRRFGFLHGVSSLLLVAQIVIAGATVATGARNGD